MGGHRKSLAGAGVDNSGDLVNLARKEIGAQSPNPADRDRAADGSVAFDFGKGVGSCVGAGSPAGGNPLAAVEAPSPEIDAVPSFVPPAADQRFHFAGHGGDDGHSFHAGVCGA
jgi:hypothetical protein